MSEMQCMEPVPKPHKTLTYLPKRPPVDLEFVDLTYTVPQGRKGNKTILKSVSGLFQSGELTAILGPSGAGKSTLLNVLAGYKCSEATGSILVNGRPRNIRQFKKMSRYIMQEDLLQPHLTVQESLLFAADLKLGTELSRQQKCLAVEEILDMLLLVRARNTDTSKLSGGERKRLSIALELVNNPPIIFLDEPTTGLDDLSSSQCITLLKMLAKGGRTIICSLHTPSAKLFAMFDHVYVVSKGQCVFQGPGNGIVPFLSCIGLECPKHYNPADFVIEVSSGEYGDHQEKMVMAVDNGKCYRWPKETEISRSTVPHHNGVSDIETVTCVEDDKLYNFTCSSWTQFRILTHRMLLQTWRDTGYLCLRIGMYLFLILIIGGLFYEMGNDASMSLFNFGFCYTCIIVFMYIPMLPVLLQYPGEVQLLKREYFNRWYSLNSYFCALTISRIPVQVILGTIYVCSVYVLTGQPLEWSRAIPFLVVCLLISFVSEGIGLAISSTLSIINGMFIGPTLTVPFMLLAVYGIGTGTNTVPIYMKIFMYMSYLRYGLEGIIAATYSNDRPALICPPTEDLCIFQHPRDILYFTGMEDANVWVAITGLVVCTFFFRALCYLLLRLRLSPHRSLRTLKVIGQFLKTRYIAQTFK